MKNILTIWSHWESITVWLISSLTRLDLTKKENTWLLSHSEIDESKLVKLETAVLCYFTTRMFVLCFEPYFILRQICDSTLSLCPWSIGEFETIGFNFFPFYF